ncbi:MAG: zinc ribbon domain-containing protein, partial [Anaerolineae bacterium]
MIHCPYCGTINKDDARVCVECGQPLPVLTADGMLCPQCGARNELGAVFCDECGTRLMPASPAATEQEPTPYASIRGLSLPKKRTDDLESPLAEEPADIAEEVPPWLQKLLVAHDLIQPAQEDEEPFTLKDREIELPAVEEVGELPIPVELPEEGAALATDWLETLRSRSEDWEQEAAEAQEVPPPSDDELADWLHDLQEPEVEVEPAPPVEEVSPSVETYPIEDVEFPAWLSDLEAEEEPAAALVPPSDESPAALTAEEEELPDWLLELRAEEPKEAMPSAVEAVPSPEEPALGESEDQEIPEWLREVRELGRDEEEEVPPAAPAGLDVEGEEEVEPSQPPAFVMPEVPTEEEEKEFEVPQWLQELQEMGPVTPAEELSAQVPSPPDWLAQPAVPGVGVEEDETLTPEWLLGPESLAGKVPDEEVTPPDWLSELGPPVSAPVEMEAVTEAPDWLEELRPAAEEEEPGEISRPPVPELPETETAESPEESIAGAEEEPEGLARADIPDWLLALRPREPGEEPVEVQEIMELGGPLAGIRGVLPVEPIISLPHLTRPKAATVGPPPISGDLFAEIVAQPPVPAAVVPERHVHVFWRAC